MASLAFTRASASCHTTTHRHCAPSRPHSRTLRVRASYDVEVENPTKAPNSGPRWGGGGPPPPPPPPPVQNRLQAPSRRELLFGFLGLGLGVAGTAAYYNAPMSDEEMTAAMNRVFAEPEVQAALEEQALLNMGQRGELLKELEAVAGELEKALKAAQAEQEKADAQ